MNKSRYEGSEMMGKNPIRFVKKINNITNSYFKDKNKNQKYLKRILKETNSLKKENKALNKRHDILEAYLKELHDKLEIEQKYCPICEKHSYVFLPFGIIPRKNAKCPNCDSLERHRQVYLYLKNNTDIFKNEIKLLHFAPETIFHNIFSELNNIDYWPVDLFRKDDYIRENVDMANIPYEDNSFDIIFNNHVLEHVPNDKKAMEELYRVVKPSSENGVVIIMVPLSYNLNKTLEKEEYNTPELRLKHYGQHDHVRIYGKDFKDKLKSVGFSVEVYSAKDLSGEKIT
jgi:predicted SAM-dependent methyltransferase